MGVKEWIVSAVLSFLVATPGAQAADVTYQGLFPSNDLSAYPQKNPKKNGNMAAHFEFTEGTIQNPDPDRIGGPAPLFSIVPCRRILKEKTLDTASEMARDFSINSEELQGGNRGALTKKLIPLVEQARAECMPKMS